MNAYSTLEQFQHSQTLMLKFTAIDSKMPKTLSYSLIYKFSKLKENIIN